MATASASNAGRRRRRGGGSTGARDSPLPAAEGGAALVTITHDLNVAGLADRRYRLDAGRLTPLPDPAPTLPSPAAAPLEGAVP